MSVYPTFSVSDKVKSTILDYAKRLGLGIGIVGLYNIQFIVDENENVYIIEVNPRSSRTVPFLSKSTDYSLADIATYTILGIILKEQGIFELYPKEKIVGMLNPLLFHSQSFVVWTHISRPK